MFIAMFGTVFAGLNNVAQPDDFRWLMTFPVLLPFVMLTCIFPTSLAVFITRLVAMVSVLNGNNFHYPFLGAKVEQFLVG
jgi:uncharacterized membrane protein